MVIGLGYGTYIFFACFCALAAIFSYFLVPKTAGKTLEQMDAVFGDSMGEEERTMKLEILQKL
jgi:Sugar (and other) transporter